MNLSLPSTILMLWLVLAALASAHPVAFEGATQVQGTYMRRFSSFEAYHTYAVGKALGINAEWLRMPRDEEQVLTAVQHNWLLKRWNLKDAQANFYAGVGAGSAFGWSRGVKTSTSAYGRTAIQADYETLWVYTAAKTAVDAGSGFLHAETTLSLGFAPYAHDYDKLATWIIVDFSYISEMDDHIRVIPKVRLFRNNWFVEAGCSLDGDPMLSCMIHF